MSNESILVVDDEPDIRNLVKEILEDEGYRVDVAEDAQSARAVRQRGEPDLVLLDIWMPDEDGVSLLKEWKENDQLHCPVVMMSGHGTVETAVEATRLGAYDFVEKPLSLAKLLLTVEQALAMGEHSGGTVKGVVSEQELVGTSRVMVTLREQALRFAAHRAPVLISGETGSGKHALARYLQACGLEPQGAFVEVTASGHRSRPSEQFAGGALDALIARARGGVLYVAEVTDLAVAAQQQLMSLAKNTSDTAARLIVATRANPEASVRNGRLSEDLFYAISALHLRVPPLREHREDVSALLEHFVNYFAQHEGLSYRHFNLAAQNRLRNYAWPGNVGELRNLVQRSMILGGGVEVGLEEVEQSLQGSSANDHAHAPEFMRLPLDLPLRQAREVFERAYLEQQLQAVDGNISELAKRAGVERTHLYRKMRSLGISPQKKRNP